MPGLSRSTCGVQVSGASWLHVTVVSTCQGLASLLSTQAAPPGCTSVSASIEPKQLRSRTSRSSIGACKVGPRHSNITADETRFGMVRLNGSSLSM